MFLNLNINTTTADYLKLDIFKIRTNFWSTTWIVSISWGMDKLYTFYLWALNFGERISLPIEFFSRIINCVKWKNRAFVTTQNIYIHIYLCHVMSLLMPMYFSLSNVLIHIRSYEFLKCWANLTVFFPVMYFYNKINCLRRT